MGIEGSSEYFEGAVQTHPDKEFHNLYVDKNNIDELPIREKFDVILMLAVLEHMNDVVDVLRGMKKYLKPEGRIVVTTPTPGTQKIMDIGSTLKVFSSETDEHEALLGKRDLENICDKAGYVIDAYRKFELGLNQLIVLKPV